MAVPASSAFFADLRVGDVVVTGIPKIDLESYVQNYSGRTLVDRLYFIGTHSTVLCIDALKYAAAEAKKGKDWVLWQKIQQKLRSVAPSEIEAQDDHKWIERSVKQNSAETARLEAELKGYKNNLIKESIRMGNEDLGTHYQRIGEFRKAYDAFGRMRQEISVQKHMADIGKLLVSVCYDEHNWVNVLANVQKVIGAKGLTPEEQRAIQPYYAVPSGIAYLSQNMYADAAGAFIATEPGVGKNFSHICSPNDVAIYGGLSALATMDRQELQTKVLESSSFRTYLELEPHIRRAITFFINGRYAACLSILEGFRADYMLDVHLARHVPELYSLIRSKSIVQYFIPFSCVTLASLQEAFGEPKSTVTDMEKELIKMIKSRMLVARVDTQNKLLVCVPSHARHELQSSTLEATKTYEKEMRRRLQKMNIIGAGLEIKSGVRDRDVLAQLDDMASSHEQQMHSGSGIFSSASRTLRGHGD